MDRLQRRSIRVPLVIVDAVAVLFTVTYEATDETTGTVVKDASLYEAMRQMTDPLERVDGEHGVLGFRETAPRSMPNHKGVLTQRRTLLVPVSMTQANVRHLARYLRVPTE
jgi:hypothetical protein